MEGYNLKQNNYKFFAEKTSDDLKITFAGVFPLTM